MLHPIVTIWVGVSLAVLCLAQAAHAQETTDHAPDASEEAVVRPVVSLGGSRTDEPLAIDARLDEEAWARAAVIDSFTQVDPVNGSPPTERTEVRLLYDADTLYLGVRCFDTQPDLVVARSMSREAEHGSDDRLIFTLDTFADRRNGYIFIVSAAGGKRDGLIEGTRTRWEWDGLWTAAARIDDQGWTAEIAIPMKTLSFDEHAPVWGFNIERFIRRKDELVRWASPSRNSGVARMNDAGDLADLTDLDQGFGLTIKPFLTTTLDIDNENLTFEPGVDIFYKITPSTTAALTINTDFAEAEVDSRRVNLTRFPLFFPEKRAFFLEDSGIFEYGGINQSPRPFFSRRIGIVGGQQKDILAGLRITGRTGRLRFGALNVQMKDDDQLGAKNLGVLRLKHDVGDESSVGLIATNGTPGSRGSNQLLGLDFNYNNSDALGGTLAGDAWLMVTRDDPADAPAENNDPFALGGRFSWNADPWNVFGFFAHVGRDFNPGLGFVQRPGEREYHLQGGYTWRPETHDWIRSVNFNAAASAFTSFNSTIESASLSLPRITLTTNRGDSVFAVALADRERLERPFEIADGVVIPIDTYDNTGWRAGFSTSAARAVSINTNYSQRGFYNGSRNDLFAAVTFRPNASLSFSANYFLNEVRLDTGDLTVRVASTSATIQFSPLLSWDTILQWDNQSDSAGLNSRLRYEFRPGQEIFLVYNEGFDVTGTEFSSTGRELTLKAGLTFRF